MSKLLPDLHDTAVCRRLACASVAAQNAVGSYVAGCLRCTAIESHLPFLSRPPGGLTYHHGSAPAVAEATVTRDVDHQALNEGTAVLFFTTEGSWLFRARNVEDSSAMASRLECVLPTKK